MLTREAGFYTAGYTGDDPYRAPFYLRSLIFDGPEGDLNAGLIDEFNDLLLKEEAFSGRKLAGGGIYGPLPGLIAIINASHDNLPTSYETARVFNEFLAEKKINIPIEVVNTREELMRAVSNAPSGVMVISQCVDKNVYNVDVADELEKKGVVVVPGKITAPGGVLSDKDSTYRLLSDDGTKWDSVARYKKVSDKIGNARDIGRDIIEVVDELANITGDNVFFVKPHEGGGGLGGFRISKKDGGYIIPDLSKVTGDDKGVHPTLINVDTGDTAKLRELLWIYRLFSSEDKMRVNYILKKLPLEGLNDIDAAGIMRAYLDGCKEKREEKLGKMVLDRAGAGEKIKEAIEIFERKFKRKYVALVNEHLDFGMWGLRAHYRLSKKGPKLEAMYSRIFQLAFTEEGVGYLGSDNISNKQTGELEVLRLGSINEIMLEAIGGRKALFKTLTEGAEALVSLAELVPPGSRGHIPLRAQFDLAVLSQRIGEGNADTARGLCLASRWSEFVKNNREWLEDSLEYYSWKKGARSSVG